MHQVENVRKHVIQYVNKLRMYIADLQPKEEDALPHLYGVEGYKTATAIADFVLVQLGHCPPEATRMSPTMRTARKIMPGLAAMPEPEMPDKAAMPEQPKKARG